MFFTSTLIVLTGVGLQLKEIQEEFKVLTENELRLNRLGGKVVHLDEVLTMSTYMAAATGDVKWEDRYYEYVIQLDTVLSEVRELAPHIYESDANRITESANVELVKLEMLAFEKVRKGNLDSAKAILNGPDYQEQKRIYSDGIQHVLYGIDLNVTNKLGSYRRMMRTMLISLIVSVTFLLIDWILILRISKIT